MNLDQQPSDPYRYCACFAMMLTPISPSASYYIRKLLRQNINRLKSVVAPGAGLRADPLGDLNAVLQSLYLDEAEVKAVGQELENLALYHQALITYGTLYQNEMVVTERKIFWLLGFKEEIA